MMTNKKIKILVTYKGRHKIIESDIFTPIQTGRAIADEVFDEMIGDDTGDNISHLNSYYCEMSAIYWAWKNYEQLGNPDYIGFIHYRRHLLFNPKIKFSNNLIQYKAISDDYLKNSVSEHEIGRYLKNHDVLAGPLHKFGSNIEVEYADKHFPKDFSIMEEIVKKNHPDYYNVFLKCKKRKTGYFLNMFVMPKQMFFEYCEFMFSVLAKCVDQFEMDGYNEYQRRLFVSERLTNVFLEKKKAEGTRVKDLPVSFIQSTYSPVNLTPAFVNNNVPIVFNCSHEYVPCLLTSLYSLKAHTSSSHNYDIIICESNIVKSHKVLIKTHIEQENISVRFLTVDESAFPEDINAINKGKSFSESTFIRMLFPRFLPSYDKVLYLDVDVIVLDDVYDLYNTDLEGNTIGACKDAIVNAMKNQEHLEINKYLTNDLRLKNHENYFQTGVIIFDCHQFRKNNCEDKLFNIIRTITKPSATYKCVLNMLFEGDVKFIDLSWSYQNEGVDLGIMNPTNYMDDAICTQYLAARKKPKIIHYFDHIKPWVYPDANLAHIWWKYARETPMYETIIWHMKSFNSRAYMNGQNKRSIIKYLRYKLLSKITFGSTSDRYKKKYKRFR